MRVEVFKAGNWTDSNGRSDVYTEADLDAMVDAFNQNKSELKPPLRLGSHNEGIAPAVGWVSGLERKGGTLFARFSDVPEIVKEAIEKGLYKSVSSGIWFNWRHRGKTWSRVLNHVAILGSALPAVKGLADLGAYLSQAEDVVEICYSLDNEAELTEMKLEREDAKMSDETKEMNSEEAVEETQETVEEAQDGAKDEEVVFSDEEKADEQNLERIKELEIKVAEYEQEAISKACSAVIENAVNDGALLPKHKDEALAIATSLCARRYSEDETNLWTSFQTLLEDAPKKVDFSEKAEVEEEQVADGESSEFEDGKKIAETITQTL